MVSDLFKICSDILNFIFDLRLVDVPLLIFYVGLCGMFGYCVSMIIIGFPCSVWEAVTKKKIPDEKQDKVIKILSICLFVIFLLGLLYDLSTK